MLSFGSLFRMAVVAGVAAGLVLGAFHLFATEPTIDAAIAIEESKMAAMPGMAEEAPVVSREMQKVGLIAGFAIYGISLGVLCCGAFFVIRRFVPDISPANQGALLALIGYWCLALGPFLKYPANPPGVGDPDSIGMRQGVAVAYMAFLLAGAFISLKLPEALGRRIEIWQLIAGNLAFAVVLWLVMPVNPDPVEMPAGLVLQFRLLSIAGLTLFWAVLGGLFVWQVRRSTPGRAGLPSALTGPTPA